MRRYWLVWTFGIVGLLLGLLSTPVVGKSYTVMKPNGLISSTQTAPTTNAYMTAIAQALFIGIVFAVIGLLITIIVNWYKTSSH